MSVDDRRTEIPQSDRATIIGSAPDIRETIVGDQSKRETEISYPNRLPDPLRSVGLSVDEMLLGQYRIVRRLLNQGAEADIYEAVAENGERLFVKLLSPQRSTKDRRERTAAIRDRMLAFDHPNLVKPVAIDLARPDNICEIYEFIEGPTLDEWSKDRELSFGDLQELTRQIAEGLRYLHERKLAHRDLKPHNVKVIDGETPRFVLVDYGTVVAVDEGGLTQVAGTPDYMPPEEMSSRNPTVERTEALARADWWALGRVIQEIISGVRATELLRRTFVELDPGSNLEEAANRARHLWHEIVSGRNGRYQPGLVELVDFRVLERARPLLRGLLTADLRWRWGYTEILAWLDGDTPDDRYDEPFARAMDQLFEIDGRMHTLREVAQHFALAENWEEGARQIREGVQRSELRYHIKAVLEDARLAEQITRCNQLAEELKDAGENVSSSADDIRTALALACIGNADSASGPIPVVIRGEIIDANLLANAALSKDQARVALSRAFYGKQVRSALDDLAEPGLSDLSETISHAEAVRFTLGSLTDARAAEAIDLWRFARVLGEDSLALDQLRATIERGRARFHSSRYTPLNRKFHSDDSTLDERRAVAFAVTTTDYDFRFVTHETHERVARDHLAKRRTQLSQAQDLLARRVVVFCSPVLNTSPLLLALAGLVLGFFGVRHAWYAPIVAAVMLPAATYLAIRLLRSFDPVAEGGRRTSISDVNSQLARLMGSNMLWKWGAFRRDIESFNAEVAGLKAGGIAPLPMAPRWTPMAAVALLLLALATGPALVPAFATVASSKAQPVFPIAAMSIALKQLVFPAQVRPSAAPASRHVQRVNNPPTTHVLNKRIPAPAHSVGPVHGGSKIQPRKIPSATAHSIVSKPKSDLQNRAALQNYRVLPKPKAHPPHPARPKQDADAALADLAATSAIKTETCSRSVSAHALGQLAPQAPQNLQASVVSGASGVVRVFVDASGAISRVAVVRSTGSTDLDAELLAAARRLSYSPAESNCVKEAGEIDMRGVFP